MTNKHKLSLGISIALLVVMGVLYARCLPTELFRKPYSTVLLDRDGKLLNTTIAQDGQWRFPPADSLPKKFEACLVEFEDRQFRSHIGFHLPSFVRAAYQNFKEGRVVSGGSTITMQVIRLSRDGQPRTLGEKLKEVVLATRLEIRHSKDEILHFWAANAPFGGNVVGLEAAAWRYYDRPAHQLSWSETATLAVLPNAPSLIYPGKRQDALLAKRNRLLDRLHVTGVIDEVSLELAKAEPLPQGTYSLPQHAAHLLQHCIASGKDGQRTNSTIDLSIQVRANQLLKDQVAILKANELHNAAALIIGLEHGEVLAYVGNVSTPNAQHGEFVDIVQARRSTGSLLKPLLFARMLDEGEMLPGALVADIPVNISGFAPKNFNKGYNGAVPANQALARSLNVPAVLMLRKHGVEQFHHFLQRSGLRHVDRPANQYGLSLVLGGAESSLWDLANAYASMGRTLNAFARSGGRYEEMDVPAIHYVGSGDKPSANRPVLSAGAIYSTFQAMQKVSRPASEMGWEEMAAPGTLAWKTGTSFGHRDAWAIGLDAEHLVAVWVGNANGEGKPGNTGVNNAAPLMFQLFDAIGHGRWFDAPYDELDPIPVCRQSGFRPGLNCVDLDIVLSVAAGLASPACPYHKLVHLDKESGLRSTTENSPLAQLEARSWFVLPPAMEWYYKASHPSYQKLPRMLHGYENTNMQMVQPTHLGKVRIPKQLDGQQGALVFEVAHRRPSSSVFWHLDDEYVGETQHLHQMPLSPPPGMHVLSLIDDQGQELVERFEVVD